MYYFIETDRNDQSLIPNTSGHRCMWACVFSNTSSPSGSSPTSPLQHWASAVVTAFLPWEHLFGVDLAWVDIKPWESDRMCHTYTLVWSAADLGQGWDYGSNGRSSGSGDARDEQWALVPTVRYRCKHSAPAANFLVIRGRELLSCSWKWLNNNGDTNLHRTRGSPI